MKKIIEQIQHFGFDDYKIVEVRSAVNQTYLLKDRVESKRTVESNVYQITVYCDHNIQGKRMRGEYGFEYKKGTDLRTYLEQARFACSLVTNRYYGLVDPTGAAEVATLDPRLKAPAELGEELTETIYADTKGANVYLSSAEIFLTRSEITLVNSRGFEASKVKGLIEIELTLIAKKGHAEQELNFEIKRRKVDDLWLHRRLAEYKEHVINMLGVRLPQSGKADVVIEGPDIYHTFLPVRFHASGQAKDQSISRFSVGTRVVDDPAQEFTLKSSGIIPFGLYSEPFDSDGIAGQEHTLIDHSVFRKYWTTKRYADYLGVEATGAFKDLVLETATPLRADLGPHYEIVQFSDLSPDAVTGDIVAEIRFGYFVNNGQREPIKGGSVSANVFASLNSIGFADECVFEGNYRGPKFIVLRGVSISGQ